MAQHAHVPKFGNWEGDGNVPYTQYFENARKGRIGGKLINPNDPQENPDAFSDDVLPVQASPFRMTSDQEPTKPKIKRHTNSEDSEPRRSMNSPLRHDPMAQKVGSGSPHHQNGDQLNSAETRRRASRMSGGSERNIEHSPLHPNYQVKTSNKGGVSSPSWERKGSSEGGHGLGPSTPSRSRMRPTGRGSETSEKGPVVPKFGEWDETNPSSADGYTHIFDKVKEEKQSGAAKVPIISTESYQQYGYGHDGNGSSKSSSCSCFGWCRK